MAKKDFDIDFNFDEAYGFDAKSDPDDEAFLNTADSDGYSGEDFDLDGDLDNFLNMGEGEEPPVPQWQDVPEADSQDAGEMPADDQDTAYDEEAGYETREPEYKGEESEYTGEEPAYDGEYDEAYEGEYDAEEE